VYTLLAQPTYHILADVDGFEIRLLDFMQRVGEHGILKDNDPSLRASTFHDAAWYGLLFAVLGSGCQLSETEPQDRILRTRVFGQSAGALFQLKRLLTVSSGMRFRMSSARKLVCPTKRRGDSMHASP
jgi:hypothetical protein